MATVAAPKLLSRYESRRKDASEHEKLDFLVDSVKEEDEQCIKTRLHRFVYEAVNDPLRTMYELEASLNYQYTENDFYTDDELAVFAERRQPPTRRNELAPILERIAGQFIQTRQVCSFLGRNTPADDKVGAMLQDTQRWVDQTNLAEFEEQDQSWDGLVGGVGWIKAWIERNALGQRCEKFKSRNPFTIFKDPRSQRYDPNDDAKYIVEGAWMDLEDCIEQWPDKEDELRNLNASNGFEFFGGSAVDPSLLNESYMQNLYDGGPTVSGQSMRRRVRPFEVWYKRKVKLHYIFRDKDVLALPVPVDNADAKAILLDLKGSDQVYAEPVWKERMYVGVILGNVLIHHDVSPHETNLFPYIPFYSGMKKNGSPLALASRLVPIVESINKRESKALALLTNRQIVAEENSFDDSELLQTEHAKPDGFLEVKEGAISNNRIVFRDNLDMGQAQLTLLQEDKDAIRRVSGQGNESMGMPSEVRSGLGIAKKQAMGNLIVLPMQNNLRRTRYMKAKLSYEYTKQWLTEEMAFQITDDPNVPRTVQITKGQIQALKERLYDIVITETKDFTVLREQQAEMLLQAIPALAPLGPAYMKLGIQLTELRDKEGLIKLIDEQSQPQPERPKMTIAMDWKEFTPEMKAYMAMTAFQSQELAQVFLQQSDDPAFVQKLAVEMAKAKLQEGTRAQVERGKIDFSALQTAIEGRMELKKIQDKGQPAPGGASEPTEQSSEGVAA